MTVDPIVRVTGRSVVIPTDNVDTDQIIPARFLKGTSRSGLGRCLFADRRYGPQGERHPEFVLNRPQAAGATVLVVGNNFGCGSSREHAAWALADYGFRAIVGLGFADIFQINALKNGLLVVTLDAEGHRHLTAQPGAQVTVDLETQTVTLPNGLQAPFTIEPFARHRLLRGVDELDLLLSQEEAIAVYEREKRGWIS